MIRFLALLTLLAAVASGQAFDAAAPDKKAGDAFKNIKILNDDPSTSLEASMVYFNTSLGVKCDFCHEAAPGAAPAFDSDKKNSKKTAREMITMTRNINKDAFKGRLQVTCFTCHQGHNQPTGAPTIPLPVSAPGITRAPQGTQMPKGDELFAKYETALGGVDKLAAVHSLVLKGTTEADGKSWPSEYRLLDGKVINEVKAENRVITYVSNGKDAWTKVSAGPPLHEGDELAPFLMRVGELYPGSHMKASASGMRVFGTATVEGHETYVAFQGQQQRTPSSDRLYFDKETGLLLRQAYVVPTLMGPLPTQIDYDDYRNVDGVRVPFKVTVSRPMASWTLKLTSAEKNAPVKDAQFEKP
jgi:hypothetical protein